MGGRRGGSRSRETKKKSQRQPKHHQQHQEVSAPKNRKNKGRHAKVSSEAIITVALEVFGGSYYSARKDVHARSSTYPE